MTWAGDLSSRAGRICDELDRQARKVAIEVFRGVILKTPVDTGRARGNWQVGAKPAAGVVDKLDKAGQGAIGDAIKELRPGVFRKGGELWLVNNLPYIRHLEYGLYPNPPAVGSQKRGEDAPTVHTVNGYSKQAPRGMVRVTLREVASKYR